MIRNKIIVISGAGGAIGKKLCKSLKLQGAYIIGIDKPGTKVNEKYVDICFLADFSIPLEAKVASDLIKNYIDDKFHGIDALINCAGVGIYKGIEKLDYLDIKQSININLTSPFLLINGLIKSMQATHDPVIINIGSGMGVYPTAGRSAYCASKFGLRGLSLSLSKELRSKKYRVIHLTLGSVMTPFGTGGIEARKTLERNGKKYLSVEEVVETICYLIRNKYRKSEFVLFPDGYHLLS